MMSVLGPVASRAEAEETPVAEQKQFYVDDIKATMAAHVAGRLDADGFFHVKDDKTDEVLPLKFVKVHDPVRHIRGSVYFACTDFHVGGDPDKLYDIDFWRSKIRIVIFCQYSHQTTFKTKVFREENYPEKNYRD